MNQTDISKENAARTERWLVVVAVIIHVVLGLHAAARLSPTNDEYWHLGIGVDILKTGRFDQDTINPPLVRVLAALPTLPLLADYSSAGIKAGDTSAFGDRIVEAAVCDPVWLWFCGRCVVLGFSLVAGFVIVAWARQVGGNCVAVVAGLFWYLNPEVLGHAALVTHDIPAAAMLVTCLWMAWRFGRRPSLRRAAGIGVTLGLALLTKFTAVLLLPLIPVTILIAWQHSCDVAERRRLPRTLMLLGSAAIVTVVAVLVVNLGYAGTSMGLSIAEAGLGSQFFRSFIEDFPALSRLPLPLPRDWIRGIDQLQVVMEHQHPVFLDGQWSLEGFRSYYLWALAYKCGHGFQAFVISGLAISLFSRSAQPVLSGGVAGTVRQCVLCGMIVVVTLTVIASLGRNQLGLRYLLPGFPFLALIAGSSIARLSTARTAIAMCYVAAVCGGWSLRHHPNHIAHFNELTGGPNAGYLHLIDSNVDWGQSLLQLAEHLENKDLHLDGLAYFGSAVPTDWGIPATPLPPALPEPGCYAVSVNYVMGRPHMVRDRESLTAIDFGQFSWFQQMQPAAIIGASIHVYEISARDAAMIRFTAGLPPLPADH